MLDNGAQLAAGKSRDPALCHGGLLALGALAVGLAKARDAGTALPAALVVSTVDVLVTWGRDAAFHGFNSEPLRWATMRCVADVASAPFPLHSDL